MSDRGAPQATRRVLTALACLGAFVSVAAGAFGAHGVGDPAAKALLQTGSHYQLVHAVAAITAVALMPRLGRGGPLAGWLFVIGGAVFGGTLYAMALGAPRVLGAVTPVGGLMLLAGWVLLGVSVLRGRSVA